MYTYLRQSQATAELIQYRRNGAFLMYVTRKLLHVGRVTKRYDVIGLENWCVVREAGEHLAHAHLASASRDQEADRQTISQTEKVGREHGPSEMLGELLAHKPEISRVGHRAGHVLGWTSVGPVRANG